MDKQVLVYYDKEITERAKNYLNNVSKDDIAYLTKKFQEVIISKDTRHYRLLYKGHLIICTMSETKNIINVFIKDIYHI